MLSINTIHVVEQYMFIIIFEPKYIPTNILTGMPIFFNGGGAFYILHCPAGEVNTIPQHNNYLRPKRYATHCPTRANQSHTTPNSPPLS